ncbi:MAG: AMP-binding protein, partial [Jatrophihabitantaceae bacterium]
MPTIAGTLRSSARRVPEAEALAFGDGIYTYRELDATVDTWAGGLRSLNVAKGDRVAVMSMNSDLFVIAFYAVLRAGAIFVPINPASAPPEIDHVVGDCGTDVLLYAVGLTSKVDAMTVPVGHCVALQEFTPSDPSMCS